MILAAIHQLWAPNGPRHLAMVHGATPLFKSARRPVLSLSYLIRALSEVRFGASSCLIIELFVWAKVRGQTAGPNCAASVPILLIVT
jgi:hypothetical protein